MWNKWDDEDDNYDQTITLCEINEMMMMITTTKL